ncbi:flagellar export protein FliJ [Gorillibacterium timonense]|uniref:flagellar export protein FliJ n=1 Tax=Gorillibacterium timonense TaxID=1689269 RepID=UPI00071C1EFD|nr:flagellar export protein FliJ [Gorillibacterium timonense]
MKFRYAFQKIVDLKSNEKTQAEWLLSSAVTQLRVEESSLTELRIERQGIENMLMDASASSTTVSDLLLFQNYLTHMDRRIDEKLCDVRTAEQQVSETRSNLSEKAVEEKVWFRARDKARDVFMAESLKKEQETLDELALTRYKRPS